MRITLDRVGVRHFEGTIELSDEGKYDSDFTIRLNEEEQGLMRSDLIDLRKAINTLLGDD